MEKGTKAWREEGFLVLEKLKVIMILNSFYIIKIVGMFFILHTHKYMFYGLQIFSFYLYLSQG